MVLEIIQYSGLISFGVLLIMIFLGKESSAWKSVGAFLGIYWIGMMLWFIMDWIVYLNSNSVPSLALDMGLLLGCILCAAAGAWRGWQQGVASSMHDAETTQ